MKKKTKKKEGRVHVFFDTHSPEGGGVITIPVHGFDGGVIQAHDPVRARGLMIQQLKPILRMFRLVRRPLCCGGPCRAYTHGSTTSTSVSGASITTSVAVTSSRRRRKRVRTGSHRRWPTR